MSYRILSCAVAVSLSLFVSSAMAGTPFMNIDFSGDNVGAQPAVDTSGNIPITKPQAIGGYATDAQVNPDSPPIASTEGTVLVGNETGMSKGAIMTSSTTNNALGAVWMDTAFSQTSSQLRLGFDVNVVSSTANATVQPKFLNNPSQTVGIIWGLNTFNSSGNREFDFAIAPTGAGGGIFGMRTPDNTTLTSFFNYNNGDTHHVDLVVDYPTATLSAYVDGTLQLSNNALQSAPAPTDTTSEFFMYLNGQSGATNSVAVDNIVASVPEPASISLALFGGGALLLRRRRRTLVAR